MSIKSPSANGGGVGPTEPDADTIKMFVGQIPRHWNEPECRTLFEKYGPVFALNILRDKQTQASKGCCFVTFYHRKDAIAAQSAMHNVEVIDGMHHPVQMKPADTENRNERKLFIGQLNKKHSEEDVRQLFLKFGHIEDCSVLRDNEGRSRGCAFVTYTSRTCAMSAIKEMHHSITMEGCSAPLVVKFADTQKDKDVVKKPSSAPSAAASISPAMTQLGGLGALGGQAALLQQLAGGAGGGAVNLQALSSLASMLQPAGQQTNILQLLGGAALLQQHGLMQSAQAATSPSIEALAQLQQAQLAQQQQQALLAQFHQQAAAAAQTQHQPSAEQLAAIQHQFGGYQVASTSAQPTAYTAAAPYQPVYQTTPTVVNAVGVNGKSASPVGAISATGLAIDPYQQQLLQQYTLNALVAAQGSAAAAAAVGSGDVKGPDGSNLFIYHLPQDFGDNDLLSTFSPFGTVLSAKVFIDKVTNLSKCFGFVSFDNALSAQSAIAAMNGFQIGTKRLKVQLKSERGNPYQKVVY